MLNHSESPTNFCVFRNASGKEDSRTAELSVRLSNLLLDNTFPSLAFYKDKDASTEDAQPEQTTPDPEV